MTDEQVEAGARALHELIYGESTPPTIAWDDDERSVRERFRVQALACLEAAQRRTSIPNDEPRLDPEMIERGAEAMWDEHPYHDSYWRSIEPDYIEHLRRQARACLSAAAADGVLIALTREGIEALDEFYVALMQDRQLRYPEASDDPLRTVRTIGSMTMLRLRAAFSDSEGEGT